MKYCISSFLLGFAALVVASPALDGATVCPQAATIEPCGCYSDTNPGYSDYIYLDCAYVSNGDARIEEILDIVLTTPNISPVSGLGLRVSSLTRVPRNLNQFKQLNWVDIDSTYIQTIPSGSFNFFGYKNQTSVINLSRNNIGTIEAGAFQGNYGFGSFIDMSSNRKPDGYMGLNRLDEDVFLPVLKQMEPYPGGSTFINLDNSPIDCQSDPCHLAWLVRDNRNMLKNLQNARCNSVSGPYLSSLNPFTLCDQ